jgi:phosphoribosylformimino-5-aminoimidazole carboxamide ribotide isomerase
MDIIPAIDLKDGKVVRLTEGLMDSAKIYEDEPFKQALKFQDMGAKWLHIVDLDGAFAKEPINVEQILKIRDMTGLNLQVGGGIRNEETIRQYMSIGVSRVILGSIALKEPDFVRSMAQKYPIVVGIDAKDGYVATEGWGEVSKTKATDLAKEFGDMDVEAIICTDISKDGTLSGVNLEFTESIARASGVKTIASGGVKDISDIEKLKASEYISGVIVGKAYYEGKIDLEKLLNFKEVSKIFTH